MLCAQLAFNTDFCALINSLSLTHVNDPGLAQNYLFLYFQEDISLHL